MNEYVSEVAPETFAHVVPLELDCHWTVGVGTPLAAAVKLAVDPALTVVFVGCEVIAGAVIVETCPVKLPLPAPSITLKLVFQFATARSGLPS